MRLVGRNLKRAASDSRVITIDEVFDDETMLAFLSLCDCYVSLHRSEGFGLTVLEAMLLGKPVICTDYSGTGDFANGSNSYQVNFSLVTLERTQPPYAKGTRWAEPSVEHASELMRQIYDNPDVARRKGQKAREDMAAQLSYGAAGARMSARLDEIRRVRRSRT